MRVGVRAEDHAPAAGPQTPSSRGLGGEEEQPRDRGGVTGVIGDTEGWSHRRGEGGEGGRWLRVGEGGQGRPCWTGPSISPTGTTSVTGWGLKPAGLGGC